MQKFQFITILLILTFCSNSLSQQFNDTRDYTLIIGELYGKVDQNDIEQLLKTYYYPSSNNPDKTSFRVIKTFPDEVTVKYLNYLPFQPRTLIFRFFSSEMALAAAIITDEIDFARTESAKMANEVHKSNPAIRVLFQKKPINFVKMIAFNNRHPICKNKNIRNAFSCTINKQYILNNLLNKQANIASGPVDKESKLYVSGTKEYKYNPPKMIELLAEEGWQDLNQDGILEKNNIPLHLTLIYEKGVLPDEDIVRMIKLDWNKIGIDISIKPLNKKELKVKLNLREFDAILINYHFNETIESFEYIFSSKGKGNFLGYYNPRVDHFLNLAKKADPSTKIMLLRAIVNTIIQDQPASFLFFLWMDWYFVNTVKFDNFENKKGKLLPFSEWEYKQK